MQKTLTYFQPTAALRVVEVFTQLPAHLCIPMWINTGYWGRGRDRLQWVQAGWGTQLNSTVADGQPGSEVLGRCSPRLWTWQGKTGLGLWRRRKEAGLPLFRKIPQNYRTGHTSGSWNLPLKMATEGWLWEQRKLLLTVSVYTSLQRFVVHGGFLN